MLNLKPMTKCVVTDIFITSREGYGKIMQPKRITGIPLRVIKYYL